MSSKDAKEKETRIRILDTAESLFSDHGFRDVSLRQITREAQVNTAAVNYHFGSKEALVTEVLTRVISPINRERLRLLEQAQERHEGDSIPIEEILECLHRPVVGQIQASSHQSSVYLKLAGRCLAEPTENFSETLISLFREMITRFMGSVKQSLPRIDEATLFWRMHFAVGTMIYALTHGDRVAMFSEGRIETPDPEEILSRLIEFTAAGLRGEVETKEKREQKKESGRKPTALVTGLLALLLLPSCKSLSPENSSHLASIPAASDWVAGSTRSPENCPDFHWIESFRSEPLESYVAAAIEKNKDLKAAGARIKIAHANARIVGADLYPQISGDFSSQRSLQNFIGLPIPGAGAGGVLSNRVNQFGLSLNMSWEIDLWGKIRAARKASIADLEASQFDRATAELSLAGQAAKAWFAMAEAKDQVALTQKTIATFLETESLLEERFEAGVEENGRNFASELLLARADVELARDRLQSQIEQAQRTSRQLEILAGKYPVGQAGKKASLPPYPGTVPADLPATLLDRRPDLAASERRLAAADERILEAKRALLPAIGLTNSFGTTSNDISQLLDGTFSVWNIAGNIAQPILQGGRLRANVSRRNAEQELAIAEFEQLALTAFGEVENALAAEEFFNKRIAALTKATRLTEDAYLRSREEFSKGTGNILTVLSAQRRQFSEQSQLLALRGLRLQNRVDLYLALGGSFRTSPDPADKQTEPVSDTST